jgi:hypothetical protein
MIDYHCLQIYKHKKCKNGKNKDKHRELHFETMTME